MDDTDRYIIRRLEEDGRIAYERIAKEMDITGAAVKKRVSKLIDGKVLSVRGQINTQALDYYLCLVLLEVDCHEHLSEIIDSFAKCPRVISMFTGMGQYNLVALTLAEDRDTLESELLCDCALRSRPGIRKSEVIQLEKKLPDPFLPVRSSLATKDAERAPCGVDCGSCERYNEELCLGCPATKFYRGDM
ncbi:MAG: Lrp/AsnC family transcriptional regulator [Methanomassiliicoccales archaeon]